MSRDLAPGWRQRTIIKKSSIAVLLVLSLCFSHNYNSVECSWRDTSPRGGRIRIGYDYFAFYDRLPDRKYNAAATSGRSAAARKKYTERPLTKFDCLDAKLCGKVGRVWDQEPRGLHCMIFGRGIRHHRRDRRNEEVIKVRDPSMHPDSNCGYSTRPFDRYSDTLSEPPLASIVPSHARLDMTFTNSDASKGWTKECGGVLIDKYWVLTAAHCLYDRKGVLVNIFVRLGAVYVDSEFPELQVSKPHEWISLKRTTNGSSEFDLALIKLPEPVRYTEFVQPACCDLDEAVDGNARLFTPYISKTNPGHSIVVLKDNWTRMLKMKVFQMKFCSTQPDLPINPHHRCVISTSPARPEHPCEGDAGNGLFAISRFQGLGTRMFVVGVISLGAQVCSAERWPSFAMMLPNSLDRIWQELVDRAARGEYYTLPEAFRYFDILPKI